SHTTNQSTTFVSAVVVHRVGKGARFYFRKQRQKPMFDLRHRIYKETELSLALVDTLNAKGMSALLTDWPLEIHIDIGQQGETKALITEIKGWVTSVGYVARIKPESFGASAVADRFTS
ncbi:MAG TPA: ribonuclease H-like YkuK family protein, partial [Paenibacillus sp.]|nr:ribonuclease H-like YkuK family protein [Paenibacillus sp.]